MSRETRVRIYIAAGVAVLAGLTGLTLAFPPEPVTVAPAILFGVLILLTMTFGVQLVEGEVSLLPMTSVAAGLVVGPIAASWAAFAAALAHGVIRSRWARPLGLPPGPEPKELAGLTAANATMHAMSVLAGGAVYAALGGRVPLLSVGWAQLIPLVLLGLAYLATNYAIAAVYIAARGWASLRAYLHSLPHLIFYEGSPLIFAALMATIYTRLGIVASFLFALILIATSLITRNLAFTSRRLERRVKELDSLRAVGQALSASLDTGAILEAIYAQVARLMPAHNFYVALYDAETAEVSFPLAVENGERVRWRARRAGNGLTEHVLRTRSPLLICQDVASALQALGLDHIGQPAVCWLGVPLLAGRDPVGIIAVQSYSGAETYDASHQEVLATIGAQAAVAIENARLYARTDEALTRRVQEMDSILRTTRDAILLLDRECRVLAANRALADLVGVAQGELVGRGLTEPWSGGTESLASQVGYAASDLESELTAPSAGEKGTGKQTIALTGPGPRTVERALTPVQDRDGAVSGWLLTLRDVTEEIEHARLKEDMTRMLVHDLRSPLTVIKGSLDMLSLVYVERDNDTFVKLLEMAQRGGDQLLRMVTDLLDISRLEDGQQPLHPQPVDPCGLLEENLARFGPLLTTARLTAEIAVEPDLPALAVDRHMLERVLGNLLHNAIKFTPDGGRIRLWARVDPKLAPGGLLVGITDSGPGIAPEEQPRLFQKFHRIDSAYGRWPGTGLGLSFCRLAVERHGGRIWVESEPGHGSTFMMVLPIVGPET